MCKKCHKDDAYDSCSIRAEAHHTTCLQKGLYGPCIQSFLADLGLEANIPQKFPKKNNILFFLKFIYYSFYLFSSIDLNNSVQNQNELPPQEPELSPQAAALPPAVFTAAAQKNLEEIVREHVALLPEDIRATLLNASNVAALPFNSKNVINDLATNTLLKNGKKKCHKDDAYDSCSIRAEAHHTTCLQKGLYGPCIQSFLADLD